MTRQPPCRKCAGPTSRAASDSERHLDFVERHAHTALPPDGTCAMGSVVDAQLRVPVSTRCGSSTPRSCRRSPRQHQRADDHDRREGRRHDPRPPPAAARHGRPGGRCLTAQGVGYGVIMARTRLDETAGLTVADVTHSRFHPLPAGATIGEVQAWFASSASHRMALIADDGRYVGYLVPEDLNALNPGRRRTRVRIRARFARRGRRELPVPEVVVRDPLSLVSRSVAAAGPAEEVLVLPRDRARAGGRRGRRGRRRGRRAPGAGGRGRPRRHPAAPARYARGTDRLADLRAARRASRPRPARRLRRAPARRARPARDPRRERPRRGGSRGGIADRPPRKARRLCAAASGRAPPAARRRGAARLAAAHARLALAEEGKGPATAAIGARRGLLIWVAARALAQPPRGLAGRPARHGCSSSPARWPVGARASRSRAAAATRSAAVRAPAAGR